MQEKINIFENKVSVFANVLDTEPIATASLKDVLYSEKVKAKVDEIRSTGNKDLKKSLPSFTASGVFSIRSDAGLVEHSGVVCIDIDKKDNTHLENFSELKQLIKSIPYVSYCGLSVSGEGYFVLIPIKDAQSHKEHYVSICEDFKRCGIVSDASCKNVSRLRFMSHDSSPYINNEAIVYSRLPIEKKQSIYSASSNSSDSDIEAVLREIVSRNIDITGSYQQWLEIGASIASEYSERGRAYFHQISQFSNKYTMSETDKKYDDCLKMHSFGIGTFFYYAKQYAIELNKGDLKGFPCENNKAYQSGIKVPDIKNKHTKTNNKESLTKPDILNNISDVGDLCRYNPGLLDQDVKGDLFIFFKKNGLSTKKLQIKS